jgi:hypothetical protein
MHRFVKVEKILQILAVFVLMMLIIHRFIRGRETAYRPYNYLTRLRPPLAAEISQRLLTAAVAAGQTDAMLMDEARQLLFSYHSAGSLTIHRRREDHRLREMQWLAAPLNCTGMALDPEDGRLYLEAEGYLFVYGV